MQQQQAMICTPRLPGRDAITIPLHQGQQWIHYQEVVWTNLRFGSQKSAAIIAGQALATVAVPQVGGGTPALLL